MVLHWLRSAVTGAWDGQPWDEGNQARTRLLLYRRPSLTLIAKPFRHLTFSPYYSCGRATPPTAKYNLPGELEVVETHNLEGPVP